MSGMGMLALGVGDAFSARHYSTALALEAEGRWLLVDCPHPIRKMLREAGRDAGRQVELNEVAGIVLTHLHADHCSGLETVGFYCRFVLGTRVRLLAHPRVAARLWDAHLAAGMEVSDQGPTRGVVHRRLADFFELITLDDGAAVECGPFRIRCRPTIHSVPTTALIVEADGASVGYSADTAFDPDLVEWLSETDLVLHETGEGHMHTPYERLAELPPDARAKMRLVHYPDGFDASAIEPLRQGSYQRIEGGLRRP
jgi:ribonuclease BN (tRNA processing enzyme)